MTQAPQRDASRWHRPAVSTPESRARVAAQAAKAEVELSRMLGIKVDPQVVERAKRARL